MSDSRPLLSLCMIVRNEERFVRQCLATVRDAVDDIVVVDTGSQDATVSIAREFGARIFEFPWTGNFSEARNHSIAQALGRWILVLDADETLARRDAEQIPPMIRNTRASGFKLHQRTYLWNANFVCATPNPKDYEEGREYSDCVQVPVIRLFRNQKPIRYHGRVHELVEPAFASEQLPFEVSSLVIHHYGKVGDAQRLEAKKQLYLDLGRRKVADNPRDAMAQLELGVQLFELGRHEECIGPFKAALKLNAAFDIAQLYIAKAYHAIGNAEEAGRSFQKCLQHSPGNDKILFDYANFVRDQNQPKPAIRLYERALAINPRHALAHFNMGVLYVRLGDVEKGLKSIRRAIQLNPANATFHENLAHLPLAGCALKAVAELLEAYLTRFPHAVRCRAILADVYFRLGDFEKSLNSAAMALDEEPMRIDSLVTRAHAEFSMGRLDAAERTYRAVLDNKADHLDSMMNLAAIAEHRKDKDLAKAWYRRAIASHPHQPHALKRYIALQPETGGADIEPELLERACAANPGDLQCLLLAGGLLERAGHPDRAAALYRASAELNPKWRQIVNPKMIRLEAVPAPSAAD